MKIEAGFFIGWGVFFLLLTAVYAYVARDIVGIVLLLFTTALAGLAGFYVRFTAKAVHPRPEDRQDAEIFEADPEYGFFSPHSWWPIATAAAAFVLAVGFLFAAWLFVFGLLLLMVAISGWLFEYYVGDHAH